MYKIKNVLRDNRNKRNTKRNNIIKITKVPRARYEIFKVCFLIRHDILIKYLKVKSMICSTGTKMHPKRTALLKEFGN